MIDNNECGAVGWMLIGRGNRSTQRKPAQVPLRTPQIPHDLTWARIRVGAVGSRPLIAWTTARPLRSVAWRRSTNWICDSHWDGYEELYLLVYCRAHSAVLAACFRLVSCFLTLWPLNTEATYSSETSADLRRTTRSCIPQDTTLHQKYVLSEIRFQIAWVRYTTNSQFAGQMKHFWINFLNRVRSILL
jgi:hypothetical protein